MNEFDFKSFISSISKYLIVIIVTILCCVFIYTNFLYKPNTNSELQTTINESRKLHQELRNIMHQLSESIEDTERAAESIGDTNTKLQENQQRTESTLGDFKESVSISRESVGQLQNRIDDIERTTSSIRQTLNKLDELQLRQQETISRAESIHSDIRKTIETNK